MFMPASEPAVSVVLPFRNAVASLNEAVDSILRQSLANFELILVDNHSEDGSSQVARQLEGQDRRICLVYQKETGIVPAIRTGLEWARAKYIARMDADDIAHPRRLEEQFRFLEKQPSVGVVSTCVRYQGPDHAHGIRSFVEWNNSLITHQQIQLSRFVDVPVIHPTVMFRKGMLNKYGSYQQGDFPEDFELWLRWLEAGVRFEKLPSPLLDWRDHAERLTRRSPRYRPEAFYRIKTPYLNRWLREHNPFYPDIVVWGAGRKSRQRAALLAGQGVRINAYIDLRADKTTTLPCIPYQQIAGPGHYFVLSYLANQGQREKIRRFLMGRGYQEGIHFLLTA